MYPETDIPPITVSHEEIEDAKKKVPRSWEDMVSSLQKQYDLNSQLAIQIFDSEYLDLFENICKDKKIPANFVASILCGTITNLERKMPDAKTLRVTDISEAFNLLKNENIAKESLEIIFESIMSGKAKSMSDAIKVNALGVLNDNELNKILDEIIESNIKIIKEQGARAIGPLMGLVMKSLRGKVDGQKLNQLLENKIKTKIT
jgi:glutamyl-tRNA(Gln) amidotransferase subunit E